MSILNGQSLLTTAMAGLTNTYSTLMSAKTNSDKGLTLDDLSNVSTNTLLNLGSNYSFLQYLTNNFSAIDTDGDGVITGNDMNNAMSAMSSKGLTYNEIQALCSSGNCDSSLLSTVLTYFNKIDANGDGRVTSEEITKFSMDAQLYDAKAKYQSYRASTASLFYSDGVEDDLTSVLDAMQPDFGTKSN